MTKRIMENALVILIFAYAICISISIIAFTLSIFDVGVCFFTASAVSFYISFVLGSLIV